MPVSLDTGLKEKAVLKYGTTCVTAHSDSTQPPHYWLRSVYYLLTHRIKAC